MIIEASRSPIQSTKGPCFGQRHALAILMTLGLTVVGNMRTTLRLSITAMVNVTVVEEQESEKEDSTYCPVPINQTHSPDQLSISGTFVWSYEIQGLVLGSFMWGSLFLQIPGAATAQRYGGKWLALSAIIWIAFFSCLVPLVAPISPFLLIAFQFLGGLGEGIVLPCVLAMLGRWLPRAEVTFLTTLAFAGNTLGTIVGQLVIGPLCQTPWGWPTSFYVSALATIIWCVLWIMFAADSPEKNPRITNEELLFITLRVGKGVQARCNQRTPPWSSILADPAVWAVVASLLAYNWIFYTAFLSFPKYADQVLHVSIPNYGIYASLPLLISLPFLFLSSFLFEGLAYMCCSAIILRKIFNSVAYLAIVVCLFALTHSGCNTLFAEVLQSMLIFLLTFILIATVPNILELSPIFSGSVLALANSFATAGIIFAPYVTDALTPRGSLQEWNNVFYFNIGLATFACCCFNLLASDDKRQWNPSGLDCPLISDMESSDIETSQSGGLTVLF